jgi:D-alanyl-D-alanine carboxypeptidase
MGAPVEGALVKRIGLVLVLAVSISAGSTLPMAPGDRPLLTTPAEAGTAPAGQDARPLWKRKIDELVSGRAMGVSVREAGRFLYRRNDTKRRTPASNQKLLLAMALLEAAGPDLRIETLAKTGNVPPDGVIHGNLWLLGRGDPNVGPSKLHNLAREVEQAGISRVKGSVMGAISYFAHDWWAPGWKPYFPEEEIPLPSALTFQGNVVGGVHISNPEVRAAKELTQQLRNRGVSVSDPAGAGSPPSGLEHVAEVHSARLMVLLRNMLRPSLNFHAEVLGKRLGVEHVGPPGTIARGAGGIRSWADDLGVQLRAFDCSGLSYRNRVSPKGMVRLLDRIEARSWGEDLRDALPGPGQGTLQGRLFGVPVHAKTGTLTEISALSGWVYLKKTGTWAEFSIISRGMSKARAMKIEDRIVRILWRHAR